MPYVAEGIGLVGLGEGICCPITERAGGSGMGRDRWIERGENGSVDHEPRMIQFTTRAPRRIPSHDLWLNAAV